MFLNRILQSFIEGINATKRPVIVSWDEVKLWTPGALEKLVEVGILVPAAKAKSIECHGCERRCFVEIIMHKNKSLTRAFIVCDDPEMHGKIGRIEIPLVRLQQWQCGVKQFAIVIANLLGIEGKIEHALGQNNVRIGMLKGSKGRRWVSLNTNPLSLEINHYLMLLEEILFFENNQLVIDKACIDDQLNRTSKNIGKIYAPSTNRREESKRNTAAMYKDWNDAYLKLKKDNPDKSDVWCSIQIARMDIAQGKDSKTIRRYMK